MSNMKGKTLVITGATKGIGKAVAYRFAKEGVNVAFTYNSNKEAADDIAKELEEKYETLPKDTIIVTACPGNNRSPFAAMFLRSKGYEAKYLEEGLIELMKKLKGAEAKQFAM